MELSNHEKIAIQSIMNIYRKIHDSLNFYEKRLDELSNSNQKDAKEISYLGSKIRSCIDRLKKEREREHLLFKKMERKYGPGSFDPMNFEYKLKKEQIQINI